MSYRYLDPERIMTEAAYWRFPGAAVAAFGEGIEDEYFCTGVRKLGESAPFDENTMFTIASCSKSFTSALAGILADRGLVDLDAPVSSYVPELQMWDAAATEKMSLKDMLCHRTGFGAHDVIWPAPYSRAEMAKRIRYIEPADAYGSPRALYSNVMYAMAGCVEESVTGKSWEELLKEYIFTPLGMSRSDGSGKVLAADANHAEPHYYKGGDVVPVPYWNVDQAGPAASVTSTLKDLVRWVKCHAYGGVLPDGRRLISEDNARRRLSDAAPYSASGLPLLGLLSRLAKRHIPRAGIPAARRQDRRLQLADGVSASAEKRLRGVGQPALPAGSFLPGPLLQPDGPLFGDRRTHGALFPKGRG